MKKYILIWDKKLEQMFQIYVNDGWNIKTEDIEKRLLDRGNIDLNEDFFNGKIDTKRYITFNSNSATIYPFYHKPKMEK